MENINQIFIENISLIMMCKNIIALDKDMNGCIVIQPGFIDAPLVAYLDFWFQSLPFSIDEEYRPICAVSEKCCFVRNDNGKITKAKLIAPIKDIVNVFNKCKARQIYYPNKNSLSDTISKLRDLIGSEKIHHTDLVGWQQFYLPAKLSILEVKYNKLFEEVKQLKDRLIQYNKT